MSEMTPQIEKMKQDLERKNAQIMEVGGDSYKLLKD
jgi:hypothetical protein